jgi:prepilin-type N-terminal cleavage/methylation domain-containing protein
MAIVKPTPAQVEAVAKAMHEGYCEHDRELWVKGSARGDYIAPMPWHMRCRETKAMYRASARAAIAAWEKQRAEQASFRKRIRDLRAFTLLELLICLVVIAILAAILLPCLAGARETARDARCLADLRTIGQTVREYHGSWRRYPREWNDIEFDHALPPRRCVRDRRGTTDDSHGLWSPVAYVATTRLTFDAWVEMQRPPGPLMASDLTVWAGENRNGVWRDGHARRIR